MKKLLSILLTLSLLLALTTFSGAAIPERTNHIAHDIDGVCCSIESPASVRNADICPYCGEKSVVYKCGAERDTADTGTHTYGLPRKTCYVDYTTSSTQKVCNVRNCDYYEIVAWHPMCDEYHSACGLGWYPTCTIYLY